MAYSLTDWLLGGGSTPYDRSQDTALDQAINSLPSGQDGETPPQLQTVTPAQKKSFWDQMSMDNTLLGVPASAWFGLASAMFANSHYNPRTGEGGWAAGLSQGLPAIAKGIESAQQKREFADWMQKNPGVIDPELAALIPPDQLAGAMIQSEMSPKNNIPQFKEIQIGNDVVTVAIDPRTGRMTPVGRGPKWNTAITPYQAAVLKQNQQKIDIESGGNFFGGAGVRNASPASGAPPVIPRITGPDDPAYAKLPKGALYLDPNGKPWRKQ